MPRVVRPMKQDADGGPLVGSQSKELGVRVPPNPHADIDVDGIGMVVLNREGMSVAASIADLPGHLIPTRLKPRFPQARGSDKIVCYTMGEGAFIEGDIDNALTLVLKKGNSSGGNIAPRTEMTVQEFQDALRKTRREWSINEQ